jgi:hypothetical protein
MKRLGKLLPVLALILATKCAAQTLPSGLFSIGKFELGKATIDDIQRYFGPSELRPLEQGDGPERALCYSNGNKASSPTVVFETGALGGWKEITAYRLTTRHQLRCKFTMIGITELLTGNTLHLRSSKNDTFQAIDKSLFKYFKNKMHLEQAYQRQATLDELLKIRSANPYAAPFKFDVLDIVEIKFKGNWLNELYVKRLVSY